MMGLPTANEALKVKIILYLTNNGATGGERLRLAIESEALKPGVTFGRLLFRQLMNELVAEGRVVETEKNFRHTFTIAR